MPCMNPHFQIKLANSLMLLGSIFIPLGMYRFLSHVSPAPHRMSLLGEGLLALAGFVVVALVLGLIGLVWSLIVEKRHPSVRVSGTTAIRLLVLVVVLAPLVVGAF